MSSPADLLKGAVDLHYHAAPSPIPRRLDPGAAAQHYEQAGFRAVVFKSHHHNTVMDVLAVRSTALEGLKLCVYGGVALNGTVGGLNPMAVELSLRMGGKIVWFPTTSSPAHLQTHHLTKFPRSNLRLMPERPISVFTQHRKLRGEVHTIIELIQEEDAVLASGHMPADEVLAVFTAAHRAGVQRLLVQHPDFILGIGHEQARELVSLGAFIEHSAIMYSPLQAGAWPINQLLNWIRVVGASYTTLGSDVGLPTAPLPAETFRDVISRLLKVGVAKADIRKMVADNPASLLGLK